MSSLPRNLSTTPATELPVALPPGPMRKRWTREEYHRLATEGWFQNQRVELIDGEINVMTPQSSRHAYSLDVTAELLGKVFGQDYWVRLQLPLESGKFGEPEPDVSVVQGARADFVERHPNTAALIVEISYSTQQYDLQTKSHLYANMGVPDYWVLDLETRQLHVFRSPIAAEQSPLGHCYQQIEIIADNGYVAPLENSTAQIAVADMLPPVKKK